MTAAPHQLLAAFLAGLFSGLTGEPRPTPARARPRRSTTRRPATAPMEIRPLPTREALERRADLIEGRP